jgi:hypothetical protein
MATKKELEIEIQRLEERYESLRIEELEGYIRTLVDENPSIFCCWKCIPNAPNPPRHVVDFFGLGLENECECKEDE